MPSTRRPLLLVALALVIGSAWGGAADFRHPQLALLGPAAVWPGARVPALLIAAATSRAAGSRTPTEALGGRWRRSRRVFDEERGRLAGAAVPVALPAGVARDGEWLEPTGPGRALREAAAPGAGGGVVQRRFEAGELVRRGSPRPEPWRLDPGLRAVRAAGLARLERVRDPTTRTLLGALLFGERADAGLADRFTRTGTRHLLALSGLHVGLVAWLVAGPLAAGLAALVTGLGRGRVGIAPEVPRALLVLALVPIGGGGAPVGRAALALALAALAPRLPGPAAAPWAGRRADALSLWSLALTLELALDPGGVRRVAVQLSYLATLALILAAGPASRRWAGAAASGGAFRAPLRVLRTGVAASVVASLATVPVLWAHFGELAPIGVVATPLALPPLALLIALGWWTVLVPACAPSFLVEVPAHALVALVEAADLVPGTPWTVPPRPAFWVGAACCAALAAVAGRGGALAGRTAAALGGALLLPWSLGPRGLELVVLDVGHGTAVAFRAPGAGTWVFDAGSRDRVGTARAALAPLLRGWDSGALTVVVSHLHRDHAGALPRVVSRWPVRCRAGARLPGGPVALDLAVGRLELPAGGALAATLIRGRDEDGNEGSRHLELRWGAQRILLCGDAEQEGLAAALDAGDLRGPLAGLLVPHHGSATPHLAALLGATRPRRAWVSSAGRAPVADELDRLGLAWADTRGGPLTFVYGFRSGEGGEEDCGRPADAPD